MNRFLELQKDCKKMSGRKNLAVAKTRKPGPQSQSGLSQIKSADIKNKHRFEEKTVFRNPAISFGNLKSQDDEKRKKEKIEAIENKIIAEEKNINIIKQKIAFLENSDIPEYIVISPGDKLGDLKTSNPMYYENQQSLKEARKQLNLSLRDLNTLKSEKLLLEIPFNKVALKTFTAKPFKAIVLHRTDTSTANKAIQAMKSGGKGVHFVVGTDGEIQRVLDWNRNGNHAGGFSPKYRFAFSYLNDFDTTINNFKSANSIGIEVVGKYNAGSGLFDASTKLQLSAVRKLVEALKIKYALGGEAVVLHGLMSPKKFTEGIGLGYDPDKDRLSKKIIDKLNYHSNKKDNSNYADARAAKEILGL